MSDGGDQNPLERLIRELDGFTLEDLEKQREQSTREEQAQRERLGIMSQEEKDDELAREASKR